MFSNPCQELSRDLLTPTLPHVSSFSQNLFHFEIKESPFYYSVFHWGKQTLRCLSSQLLVRP